MVGRELTQHGTQHTAQAAVVELVVQQLTPPLVATEDCTVVEVVEVVGMAVLQVITLQMVQAVE
jgi:hypothetical protein